MLEATSNVQRLQQQYRADLRSYWGCGSRAGTSGCSRLGSPLHLAPRLKKFPQSLCASAGSPHKSPPESPAPGQGSSSRALSLPGKSIPQCPLMAGGWPGPWPASLGWALVTAALGGPGMFLQPCRNAAGLVGKSSFLAFHCSLLVSRKLSTGGEKQKRGV